jgi:hypothetical protein
MSSSFPRSSSLHWERVLLPADNSAHDTVGAGLPSNALPVPSRIAPGPRQLLTDVSWGPRFKHYVHSPRRSINNWLSVEILTDIFLYAVEAHHMSPYQLITVCRRWRNVINSMTHLWSALRLGTWTEIENVRIWIERSRQGPLTITINPHRDAKKHSGGQSYAGLQYAFTAMDQWQDVVIAGFPPPEAFGGALYLLTAKHMSHLRSLEVGERCLDSAALTLLLDCISKTAILLSHMTLLVPHAISFFLQPQRHHVLSAVTTLIVDGRGISEPVHILPLLVHLQILEVSHLPLPDYNDSISLPFLSTLKQLKLRAVPIHWMAGREFRRIEDCTVIHAIGQQSIQQRIDLPSCRTLTYDGHPISALQHFHAPQVKQLVLNSYDTNGGRVQQHLDYLCRSDGKMSQLHTLHLMLQCSEKVLINVLKYMDLLQELVISIAYPSSTWVHFLESLTAEPSSKDWPRRLFFDHIDSTNQRKWVDWCSSRTWHSNVLPHLRYLGIQSPKGFSQSECFDNFPVFAFVAWSRKQLSPPLEHLKVWEGRGTTDDIVVDYISTEFLGKHLGTLKGGYYWGIVSGMVMQYLNIDYHEFPLFKQLHPTVLFRQLQTLRIKYLDHETYILPYLGQIKYLAIESTQIPAYSVNIDLPCVHTLQKLKLFNSTYSWMFGRTFHTLKKCTISTQYYLSEDLSVYKGVQVHMPACTKLRWLGSARAYPLFYHPNVQILELLDLDTHSQVILKSLHNSLSNCPCLQELRISTMHCSGLDSLIQFVFCDAQEQGVWGGIRTVELRQLSSTLGERVQYKHINEIVGQTQHYRKWWKEFTVSKGAPWSYDRVILRATM